jgi:hypothetical protein
VISSDWRSYMGALRRLYARLRYNMPPATSYLNALTSKKVCMCPSGRSLSRGFTEPLAYCKSSTKGKQIRICTIRNGL